MTAKNRITTNLDGREYEELVALSSKLDVSLAWLGRRAFSDLLAKYDKSSEDASDFLISATATKKPLNRA